LIKDGWKIHGGKICSLHVERWNVIVNEIVRNLNVAH